MQLRVPMHGMIVPTYSPRTRRLATCAVLGGAAIAGLLALASRDPVARTTTTVVTVPMPVPAPIFVTPPPAAPVVVAPAVVEPPPVRAGSPRLDAGCIASRSTEGACGWDTGFPAISADGRTIVSAGPVSDGVRGLDGFGLTFVDARTSATRAVVVVEQGEYVTTEDPAWPALRAKIASRVAAAQHQIEAGSYRTIVVLGTEHEAAGLRTELDGDAVRVIDVATSTAISQARFPVEEAFPPRVRRDDDQRDGDCYPTRARVTTLAWDPVTRTLLTTVSYGGGPCSCPDAVLSYVRHVR